MPNRPLPADPLTLQLDPDERTLATVDGTGELRLVSYPALTQSSPAILTAVTSAFVHCFTTVRALAPVAWSPDGRYLATADDAHATVVRRACDGSIAVTLPPPIPNPDVGENQSFAPAFVAFNRQGFALAVLRVSGTFNAAISYYKLSVAAPN